MSNEGRNKEIRHAEILKRLDTLNHRLEAILQVLLKQRSWSEPEEPQPERSLSNPDPI